ncbi:MAG: GAF domain-containing protein [Nocardioides sp.]
MDDAHDVSWLGLLLRDAPLDELHAFQVELLAGDHDPAEVERNAQAATTIHQRLAEQRQAAQELAVLNELARRLAGLHDTTEVLQEVVSQARRLLGVDITYIMLRTPEDKLRIEVLEGSMGSALRGIELDKGEGLGGVVLETESPLWTESYLDDPRLNLVPRVSAAATAEQLGGILGVPLQVRDETIGVLLAADRRPRTFADHAVGLLAALAAHAAIALRNAEIFGQYQAAVVEQQSVNDSLHRINNLRERLTGQIIRGAGLQEIAEALHDAVAAPVAILGGDGRPAFHGGAPAPVEELLRARPDVGVLGDRMPTGAHVATEHSRRVEAGGRHAVLVPVVLRDGYAGVVMGVDEAELTSEQVTLLEVGAAAVALVASAERMAADADRRARGELLSALLSREVDEPTVRRRALAAGVDLEGVRTVVVLDSGGRDDDAAVRVAARLARELGGLSAAHAGRVVVLLPEVAPEEARTRLTAICGGALPAAVGLAPSEGGMAGVREAHAAAHRVASLLLALGRDSSAAVPAELGVYAGLFSVAGRNEIAAFVEASVGTVLQADAERGRELAATLDTYLRLAQHHARTCAELHIHANTLYHRLDRLTDLLGPDWRQPDRALEIALALRLRRLMLEMQPG